MFKFKPFQLCLAFVFISITGLVSHCLSETSDLDFQPILVWSERDNQGIYNIHFSRHLGEQWSRAKILSAAGNQEILPAVSSDGQGNIWVAWTELQGIHGKIRSCFFVDEEWNSPAILETPTVSDMAPSLAISDGGIPWLVFSGSDGTLDDIYAVHWTGKKWSQPVKINSDDDSPDILPDITIASNGQPVVIWQGYNGEQYVTYSSRWNGSNWSAEQEVLGHKTLSVSNKYPSSDSGQLEKILQNLPVFLTDTSQAVLYHFRVGKGETIKLRKRR